MGPNSVFETIQQFGIVPVVVMDSAQKALPLADALLEAGLPIVEVTFRTAAAAEVIEIMASERPELLVGAGTVITKDNLEQAKACGAKFAVAPGLNPAVVTRAGEIKLPFMPGIANPSDIEIALSLGCRVLKYFPAEALGGLKLLRAMAAPYNHTGVKFVPTGGITQANLGAYLSEPSVAAAGGTWLAKQADLSAGRWKEIVSRCQAAAAAVRKARSQTSD